MFNTPRPHSRFLFVGFTRSVARGVIARYNSGETRALASPAFPPANGSARKRPRRATLTARDPLTRAFNARL